MKTESKLMDSYIHEYNTGKLCVNKKFCENIVNIYENYKPCHNFEYIKYLSIFYNMALSFGSNSQSVHVKECLNEKNEFVHNEYFGIYSNQIGNMMVDFLIKKHSKSLQLQDIHEQYHQLLKKKPLSHLDCFHQIVKCNSVKINELKGNISDREPFGNLDYALQSWGMMMELKEIYPKLKTEFVNELTHPYFETIVKKKNYIHKQTNGFANTSLKNLYIDTFVNVIPKLTDEQNNYIKSYNMHHRIQSSTNSLGGYNAVTLQDREAILRLYLMDTKKLYELKTYLYILNKYESDLKPPYNFHKFCIELFECHEIERGAHHSDDSMKKRYLEILNSLNNVNNPFGYTFESINIEDKSEKGPWANWRKARNSSKIALKNI
jgi:hypothetical protein